MPLFTAVVRGKPVLVLSAFDLSEAVAVIEEEQSGGSSTARLGDECEVRPATAEERRRWEETVNGSAEERHAAARRANYIVWFPP